VLSHPNGRVKQGANQIAAARRALPHVLGKSRENHSMLIGPMIDRHCTAYILPQYVRFATKSPEKLRGAAIEGGWVTGEARTGRTRCAVTHAMIARRIGARSRQLAGTTSKICTRAPIFSST
jgi:hypothetical protein